MRWFVASNVAEMILSSQEMLCFLRHLEALAVILSAAKDLVGRADPKRSEG